MHAETACCVKHCRQQQQHLYVSELDPIFVVAVGVDVVVFIIEDVVVVIIVYVLL
jgi:hypothetical protein